MARPGFCRDGRAHSDSILLSASHPFGLMPRASVEKQGNLL